MSKLNTYPDCMQPDGCEPCRGYAELYDKYRALHDSFSTGIPSRLIKDYDSAISEIEVLCIGSALIHDPLESHVKAVIAELRAKIAKGCDENIRRANRRSNER